ncbi:MAG TPA: hypothetical protein VFX44_10205 [Solirubrobacterales bacterium]|nr:hypothetical protein [Solirubrobacterales bacterium]
MKYVKMLGLAAIAAAALMAFVGAGSASATTLTCEGSACSVGANFHSESNGKAVLDAPFGNVECNSTVQGEVTSATEASVKITELKWTNCGSDNVVTLASGTLKITNIAGTKNGTVTSTGAEVTVEHVGTHCIFKTNGTSLGTLTGTTTTGATGSFDISATIPRSGGRSGVFCGSSAPWTGSYSIDAPMTGDVDA